MTEQFAFNQLFRDGGAIHFHKRRAGSTAHEVNVAADQFLAGSAFPINKDAAVGWRDNGDLLPQCLGWYAFPNNIESFFELLAQLIVGLFKPAI